MKKLLLALLFVLPLAATSAHAASAQNNKMKTCSADFKATGKDKSERKAFMTDCLKKDSPEKAAMSDKKKAQQEKMKTCNADAKTNGKKGDDRKAFMKECLSK